MVEPSRDHSAPASQSSTAVPTDREFRIGIAAIPTSKSLAMLHRTIANRKINTIIINALYWNDDDSHEKSGNVFAIDWACCPTSNAIPDMTNVPVEFQGAVN